MRRNFAIMALAITATSLGQTNDKSKEKHGHDEQLIMQIEQDMAAAIQKGDAAPFERYIADTFVFTDSNGEVADKTRLVSDIKSVI
jgi:Domain of unknown function (DUF4440)